jgi:hypothetical protein
MHAPPLSTLPAVAADIARQVARIELNGVKAQVRWRSPRRYDVHLPVEFPAGTQLVLAGTINWFLFGTARAAYHVTELAKVQEALANVAAGRPACTPTRTGRRRAGA